MGMAREVMTVGLAGFERRALRRRRRARGSAASGAVGSRVGWLYTFSVSEMRDR